jgi:D-alanyl-D-alanine carboxypeptidase/D-alanyl-D-alanine-endopeptidase (penicillin-binding protein 4)
MSRFVVFAALLLPTVALAGDPLAEKIEAVIDGKDYAHARWGIRVVDAKTGDVIFDRHADKMATPASVTKLFSGSAALIALGADHRFQTHVYRRGKLSDAGTVEGDLILVASGDLTFGGRGKGESAAFADADHTYSNSGAGDAELTGTDPLYAVRDLARQIKAAGVKAVAGEIQVDERLFARARGTGSGPDVVSPMVINDNLIDARITPAKAAGEKATVRVCPDVGLIAVDAEVKTGEADSSVALHLHQIAAGQFTLRGSVPAGGKPVVRIFPIDEPALFARAALIRALRAEGVTVEATLTRPQSGELPAPATYAVLPKVATWTSEPFSEALKVTLKTSHNLYASTLPCLLAAEKGRYTLDNGLKEQGRILKKLGLDTDAVSFGGGAGGANADVVTPAATVELLRLMAKRDDWKTFKAALPILGVDGTLADVVGKDSPARGKVFAKTGTLIWVDGLNQRSLLRSKALAGTMTTKSGRELFFAVFVNDVPLPPGVGASREGKVLGRLCELLYDHCPAR